jgi:hypothetical protein
VVERILEKIEGISREVDNNGWTPLHLAAYFNKWKIAEKLLDKDREVAYMKDTKGRTPLHIAAQYSWPFGTMKVIIERCPDCCELVDNRGWNVLHFAIKRGDMPWCLDTIMEIIKEKRSLSNLLNEKNAEGDAPLHFYFKNTYLRLPLSKSFFLGHPQVDKKAFNKQNLNAREIVTTVKHSSKEVIHLFILLNFEKLHINCFFFFRFAVHEGGAGHLSIFQNSSPFLSQPTPIPWEFHGDAVAGWFFLTLNNIFLPSIACLSFLLN